MVKEKQLDWEKLLSTKRHSGFDGNIEAQKYDTVHAHQRDFDRIMFSSAFRRLQGKTQVFIFPETDYVRNRLTHTLEVVNIARLLTTSVLRGLNGRATSKELVDVKNRFDIEDKDIVEVVAAAACAHDIGNAPFGHIGEYAIRSWFKTIAEDRRNVSLGDLIDARTDIVSRDSEIDIQPKVVTESFFDFEHFDGNPQGFRIVTKLQGWPNKIGGLQLTCATLASMVKYPWFCSAHDKWGFYRREIDTAISVFQETGLYDDKSETFFRHPLSFIMEAADDIAYITSDLEDGLKYGLLKFKGTEDSIYDLYHMILTSNDVNEDRYRQTRDSDQDRAKFLRAAAIIKLVQICEREFIQNYSDIMHGRFTNKLLDGSKSNLFVVKAKKVIEDNIYYYPGKIIKETAAYKTIQNLFDEFGTMAEEYDHTGGILNDKNKNLYRLLATNFDNTNGTEQFGNSPYERYLMIIDFISGMTDNYAKQIGEKINGNF